MLAIIFTIIFAIAVAFFATQNTASVIINIPQYSWSVPLYIVVLVSLLLGFVFAWILHLMNAFTSLFA
ncbi:MAG: LapA family protein, partial [bacterium]|nr:LapA family protein [bacterium]